MGTLISMLNQGFGTWRQGLRLGSSRAWGLGHQAPFMRTEVAKTKPKRKLRCFDATRLIQTRLPGLRTGNQLVQQADVARTVSGPTLLGLGPRAFKGLGPGPPGAWAQAPSGLLAGYYASLSCKGQKELFTLSVTETIQHAPKVGGGFRVSYD